MTWTSVSSTPGVPRFKALNRVEKYDGYRVLSEVSSLVFDEAMIPRRRPHRDP